MPHTKGKFGMSVEEINAASKKRSAEIQSQSRTKKRLRSIYAEEFNFPTGGMSSWCPKK